ncbi:Small ubiquitin-related modifier 2 [Camellia lanceoleosa]|nr:Small ubiquitin-related modifier 2 [Camellia lanceoleosa]
MSGMGAGKGPQSEDQKPNMADQSQSNQLNIKVKNQFRINRNTQLRKPMSAYCDRQSLDPKSILFLFDGRRIHAEQTPDQLGMEDCDEVDAMLHQTGGGGFGDI